MPRQRPHKPKHPRTAEPGRLRSLLADTPSPVLLIGAGASVTCGIPAAGQTVDRAAKWAWCMENGRKYIDPAIRKSDYQPWLTRQAWFDVSRSYEEQYALAIENLLGSKKDRRNFFEELINPQVPPNRGYRSLAKLLHARWIETVLTTNFDDCLHKAAILENKPHHLVKIKTADDLVQFSTTPRHPQLIYLHGSVEHYTDKNLTDEVQALNIALGDAVRPLLRDRALIVVGYSGTEPSIMNGLFLGHLGFTRHFAQGIYWCVRKTHNALSPLTQTLAEAIASNFTCIQIEDFDDLFERDLWGMLAASSSQPTRHAPTITITEIPLDMRPSRAAGRSNLDETLLRARLVQYAGRLGMQVPASLDTHWVTQTATTLDLLHHQDDGTQSPTNAAVLLFSTDLTFSFPSAHVHVAMTGPAAWLRNCLGADVDLSGPIENEDYSVERTITGNLWSQVDQVTDLLTHFNYTFRLKAEISKQVQAYSPLALKEMLINAVVHRDYQRTEPISLAITPRSVSLRSPGGLLPEVSVQIQGQALEDFIKSSRRGVKGYRNPVLSDLMYGGGQMDREGSGLSDMWKTTVNNNGSVTFGPSADNEYFSVEITARPEIVDEITNTAISATVETRRYAANAIPFNQLPEKVWCAATPVRTMGSLRSKPGGHNLPPGSIDNLVFYTFYDLREIARVTDLPIERSDIWTEGVDEVLESANGHNIIVQLLNDALFSHFTALGLEMDYRRKRVHFPLDKAGVERTVTYRGRAKRATRTVVKARKKRESSKVSYYEHKSLTFQVSDFADDWAVVLTPGYVFTRDGMRNAIGRERINSLSTRRAAKDFNQTVHNDVTFWIAVISEESDGIFALRTDQESMVDYMPTILLSSRPPTVSFDASAFDESLILDVYDDDLQELDEELIEIAETDGFADDNTERPDDD
jgi:NAD-dependent SIR2 family protein deacetylase